MYPWTKILLRRRPGFAIFEDIKKTKCLEEIEVALAKFRYDQTDKDEEEDEEITEEEKEKREKEQEEIMSKMVLDYNNLDFNYTAKKATDFDTCRRVHPPKLCNTKTEIALNVKKDLLLNGVKEYIKDNCDEKGRQKKTNLTKTETKGLRKLRKRVKEREIVVMTSDKQQE